MEYEQNYQQALLNAGVALTVFSNLGFEFATKSNLTNQLRRINPEGATAMRDAIMVATKVMIDLGAVVAQLGGSHVWNFVHIVLTDGDDTCSNTRLDEACGVMYAIGKSLKVSTLKTYFVGVDLATNSKAALEMAALALSGGENAEYFNINHVQINDIFEKIKLSLGVIQRTEMFGVATNNAAVLAYQHKYDAALVVEEQRYVVLFTLDISGSMSGTKWSRVCDSIKRFVDYLGPQDLVGGIVFNGTARLVLSDVMINNNNNRPVYLNNNNSQRNQSCCKKFLGGLVTICVVFLLIYFLGRIIGFIS